LSEAFSKERASPFIAQATASRILLRIRYGQPKIRNIGIQPIQLATPCTPAKRSGPQPPSPAQATHTGCRPHRRKTAAPDCEAHESRACIRSPRRRQAWPGGTGSALRWRHWLSGSRAERTLQALRCFIVCLNCTLTEAGSFRLCTAASQSAALFQPCACIGSVGRPQVCPGPTKSMDSRSDLQAGIAGDIDCKSTAGQHLNCFIR
jgi:hypothetical protein